MKITIEVDMSPAEAREFLGLPDVEQIHEQLTKNAQKYLSEAGGEQYQEIISTAMQPMLAYQEWLRRLMTDTATKSVKK